MHGYKGEDTDWLNPIRLEVKKDGAKTLLSVGIGTKMVKYLQDSALKIKVKKKDNGDACLKVAKAFEDMLEGETGLFASLFSSGLDGPRARVRTKLVEMKK